jgi:hypothetical protein
MKSKEKFEYFIFQLEAKDRSEDEEDLDEMGADGWELVTVIFMEGRLLAFLKRRLA